ncbi:hypothetical protein ABIB10_005889 [Bradyrhizobium sp. RT3b]
MLIVEGLSMKPVPHESRRGRFLTKRRWPSTSCAGQYWKALARESR